VPQEKQVKKWRKNSNSGRTVAWVNPR